MERGNLHSLSHTQSCTSILNLEEDVKSPAPPKEVEYSGYFEGEKKKCFERAKIFSFEN